MLLPIMTIPITSRTTIMIVTLFSTNHSRSLSNGPRIRADATRWATNRYRHGRSGDRREQYDDNCGLTAAEPGLSDDETGRESKQQVLRNHR